ncbi:hypothetical protein KEM55_007612 [Ascosphaera atra]|nr:hypothetical protein KEM55_007612 [Ascosphaera atra]
MRGYNLMAPAVTQKPYLKLEREWATCYAAVNPTLPDELRKRQKEQAEKMTERSASSSGASSGGGRSIWSFFGL